MMKFVMKRSLIQLIPALLVLCAPAPRSMAQSITLESNVTITDGGEIIAFSADGDTVASNVNKTSIPAAIGVQLYTLDADGTLAARELVDLSAQFGGAIASVSSVALDPLGRGFGVASVIPTANGTTQGVVVFFNYRSGSVAVLDTLTVGFHPDSVSFSRDGSKVFVANEGEFTSGGDTDAPGSVSIINLAGITTVGDVAAALDNGDVTTVDFTPANLGPGVTLDDLRFNDKTFTAGNAHRHVEPEYLTEGDGKVYATLQENNAIAEVSLTGPQANKITAIFPLGTIEQTIDASDRDNGSNGPAALIDDVVKGVPMPDTVASFVSGGVRYLVTANEGDFRPDDADRIRIGDAGFTGVENGVTIDRSNAALGRLRVVRDLSDPDNNGLIDDVIMPGTRSFTVWNASNGAFVADTGSFEELLLDLYPTLHNMNGESSNNGTTTLDARSPDKGPEPEAIATGVINGHRYVFVAMERQGAILMYNLDNPANPTFVASINNLTDGLVAPESITFLSAAESPLAEPTLLVGYEAGGKIAVYSVVGEPATPPTVTVRPRIQVGARTPQVVVSGKASANTAQVFVGPKLARGTQNWTARVPFPLKRQSLSLKVVAVSTEGLRATRTVVIRRNGRR
jgi:hypothetical protein